MAAPGTVRAAGAGTVAGRIDSTDNTCLLDEISPSSKLDWRLIALHCWSIVQLTGWAQSRFGMSLARDRRVKVLGSGRSRW